MQTGIDAMEMLKLNSIVKVVCYILNKYIHYYLGNKFIY